nr:reverse transcriptase domain-containing protein [Tanacetum cinerariifolium]
MRTRSNFYPFNSTATIPRRSNRRHVLNIVEPEIRTIEEIVSMADRTMEELLQAPTEGYGEAIVIPKILAENFEIKTNLLQLVQANKFHGFVRDNPRTHISNFKRMIATLKYRDVPNDAIKLMLFPYSLEGAARIWDSVSKTDDRIDKHTDQISNLVEIVNKQVIAPAKVVEKACVTCGGAHAYYDCIATDSNQHSVCAATGSYNQVSSPNRASHQIPPPDFAPEENLKRNLNNYMRSILGSFFQNQPSTSGTLPNVPNPKGEMKAVTTRSGLAYEGPSIPTNSPLEKVDEQNTEEIMDKEHSNCPGSTAQVQPSVVPISIPEPNVSRTQSKPTIPYPSRLNDQKLHEKATNQMEKFFQIFHDLHFEISFADALLLMPKFASTIKTLLTNKDKLFELAKVPLNENCSAMLLKKLPEKLEDPGKFLIPCDFLGMEVCHALADLGASINLMPLLIWKKLSIPELTPTRMTLELADRSITHPKGVAKDVFFKVGKFYFPIDFVVVDFKADPRVTLLLGRSFLRTRRALIDVYGEEITLRVNDESVTFNLNQTMRYSLTYDDNSVNRVDVIDIACEEFFQDVLDFQYNPKSSNPTLVPENDFSRETIVKSSSPTLTSFRESDFFLEEIKDFLNDDLIPTGIENSEVIKLLDAGMIYHISDSLWVSPIYCIPKKGGMTVIANENIELIPTRLVTGWRVCIDYKKLNDATRKDYFPLPFMDQMLKRLARNKFYCFLDGFSGYFQILIDPQDQEKTTFTCPYGTFTYRRIPFGLCNAPGTFQRPMTHLLEKETPFVFSKECIDAFNTLKKKLTEALILVVPDWNLPFELMCDASDFAIDVVLGQRKTKHFQFIHYASKIMTEAQIHYMTTEREMLAVVYAFEKFQPYLVLSKSIVYTDHSALKYFLNKQDAKPRLLRWVLLLQEFDIIILDKKGSKNLAADHLSRLENPHKDVLENKGINENFPLETLGSLSCNSTLWVIISDRRTHFCNDQFMRVMIKYGVTHRLATAYHPWTSGQVEVSNRGLKRVLERTVRENRASWSDKLDDALWAFHTAYKTPIGCTPYKLVYGKSCHLLIELEHRAYWALKHVNFDLKTAGDHRKLQLNKLSELRNQAYANSVIYKERMKKLHDSKIKNHIFNVGDQVLLFNSHLKIFSGKLKTSLVNGHRVKHYFGGDIPSNVVPDLNTFLMDN